MSEDEREWSRRFRCARGFARTVIVYCGGRGWAWASSSARSDGDTVQGFATAALAKVAASDMAKLAGWTRVSEWREVIECPHCSKLAPMRKGQRGCSRKCSIESKRRLVECRQCRCTFTAQARRSRHRKYCSQACTKTAQTMARKLDTHRCPQCDGMFRVPGKASQVCCSKRCAAQHREGREPELQRDHYGYRKLGER